MNKIFRLASVLCVAALVLCLNLTGCGEGNKIDISGNATLKFKIALDDPSEEARVVATTQTTWFVLSLIKDNQVVEGSEVAYVNRAGSKAKPTVSSINYYDLIKNSGEIEQYADITYRTKILGDACERMQIAYMDDAGQLLGKSFIDFGTRGIAEGNTYSYTNVEHTDFVFISLDDTSTYRARMSFVPEPVAVVVGESIHLTAVISWDSFFSEEAIGCQYESEDPDIATVDSDGNVTGITTYETAINVTYGSLTDSVQVTVHPGSYTLIAYFDEVTPAVFDKEVISIVSIDGEEADNLDRDSFVASFFNQALGAHTIVFSDGLHEFTASNVVFDESSVDPDLEMSAVVHLQDSDFGG